MQDSNQPNPAQFSRPSARPMGGMPIQRGNYGIPPRQQQTVAPVAAQPSAPSPTPMSAPPNGPRSMDIMPPSRPAPVQPPVAPTPVAQVVPTPAPVPTPVMQPPAAPVAPVQQEQLVSSTPAQQPLFSNVAEQPQPATAKKHRNLVPIISLVVIGLSILLVLGGGVRLATAGSVSGKKIAAGAVVSNDGSSMTIQFVAEDGKMHKFTTGSNDAYIPGSAVEVAYRSGAADTTGKQVAPIKAARNNGIIMMVTGAVLGSIATVVYFATRTSKPHVKANAIAQTVAASGV